MTRVSVALGTFDGERFLRDQLLSILRQSRPVDEIVVADDGSHDATLDIVAEVGASTATPIRVLPPTARAGVAGNFERALRGTTGDVILLSDQDDVWVPDRVARSLAALDADPSVLLVHADARLVGPDGAPLGARLYGTLRVTRGERRDLANGRAARALLRRNLATGATMALRRPLLDAALPVPPGWLHDEWLAMVAAAHGASRALDDVVIDYRQHGANQVGATALAVGDVGGRLVGSRSARNARLLERAEQLAARAPAWVSLGADAAFPALAAQKLEHERIRSGYPDPRWRRIAPVARELLTGRYSRFGRARFDVARDLLQSAE